MVFRSQIFGGTSQKKWKKSWHNLWKVLSDPCGPGARLAPGLKPLRLPRARKQGIDPFVANQSAIFHMWAVAIEQHVGQHETITPSRPFSVLASLIGHVCVREIKTHGSNHTSHTPLPSGPEMQAACCRAREKGT